LRHGKGVDLGKEMRNVLLRGEVGHLGSDCRRRRARLLALWVTSTSSQALIPSGVCGRARRRSSQPVG
jgi:hypothetical protein